MAIGFKPNTQLGKDSLSTLENGAYLVDLHQKTSLDSVYAIQKDGTHIEDTFDILILATGSTPTNIETYDVQTLKNFDDAQRIDNSFDHFSLKEVIIAGAGLIGLELSESAHNRNKDVIVVEKNERILHKYFDSWISDEIQTLLNLNGITTHLNTALNDTYFNSVEGKYRHQCTLWQLVLFPIQRSDNTL